MEVPPRFFFFFSIMEISFVLTVLSLSLLHTLQANPVPFRPTRPIRLTEVHYRSAFDISQVHIFVYNAVFLQALDFEIGDEYFKFRDSTTGQPLRWYGSKLFYPREDQKKALFSPSQHRSSVSDGLSNIYAAYSPPATYAPARYASSAYAPAPYYAPSGSNWAPAVTQQPYAPIGSNNLNSFKTLSPMAPNLSSYPGKTSVNYTAPPKPSKNKITKRSPVAEADPNIFHQLFNIEQKSDSDVLRLKGEFVQDKLAQAMKLSSASRDQIIGLRKSMLDMDQGFNAELGVVNKQVDELHDYLSHGFTESLSLHFQRIFKGNLDAQMNLANSLMELRFYATFDDCLRHNIPVILLHPQEFIIELENITMILEPTGRQLAIPYSHIDLYYTEALTSCEISEQRIYLHLQLPVLSNIGPRPQIFHIKPLSFKMNDSKCEIQLPSSHALWAKGEGIPLYPVEIDGCDFRRDKICKLPVDIHTRPSDSCLTAILQNGTTDLLSATCKMACEPFSGILVTRLTDHSLIITGATDHLLIKCKSDSQVTETRIPIEDHTSQIGSIEVTLECRCSIWNFDQELYMESQNCHNTAISVTHILPALWVDLRSQTKVNMLSKTDWDFNLGHSFTTANQTHFQHQLKLPELQISGSGNQFYEDPFSFSNSHVSANLHYETSIILFTLLFFLLFVMSLVLGYVFVQLQVLLKFRSLALLTRRPQPIDSEKLFSTHENFTGKVPYDPAYDNQDDNLPFSPIPLQQQRANSRSETLKRKSSQMPAGSYKKRALEDIVENAEEMMI